MLQKTKDYSIFKLREDNRDGGPKRVHIEALKRSISTCNLLEIKPIDVNSDMEVIDGQHRLMAAQELGLDIYYNVKKDLKPEDIILLNVSKSWVLNDYLNYYCKNGYDDYIKLKKMIDEEKIALRLLLQLRPGKSNEKSEEFKKGLFKFKQEEVSAPLFICKGIIKTICKSIGNLNYLHSNRLWKALIQIIKHPNFDLEKMVTNINLLSYRITPKANVMQYRSMFCDIHNHRNKRKVLFELSHEEAEFNE